MFHFILLAFTVLFPHCPQIAKASLDGQCLYNTKYALQKGIQLTSQQKLFR